MLATVFALLFVSILMVGSSDGKKFIVSATVSVEGKNSVVLCGAIYTTEGLGYKARGGEVIYIPVDGNNCYQCGPCTYPTGMICTRTTGECLSPSRPTERLDQRLGRGRSIISIDESKPGDEVYTGIIDSKINSKEYKVEAVPPIANLDPSYLKKLAMEHGSGDGSGGSGDIKRFADLGAFSGDEGSGTRESNKGREGSG